MHRRFCNGTRKLTCRQKAGDFRGKQIATLSEIAHEIYR
jgi:hypothetical protein